jgi:hypothetical protein
MFYLYTSFIPVCKFWKFPRTFFPFPHPGNFQMSSTQFYSNFTKSKSLRSFSYIYEMRLLLNTTYLYVTKRVLIMGKDISLDVKTSCKNQNCSVFGERLLSPRTHGAIQKMKCLHLWAFHFLKCLTLF